MAKDISAVGARVIFDNGFDLEISEFSDEGTPFDAPDIDVSTNAKNLNGQMISSRTPSVYPFSVTVIPGTVADYKLHQYLMDNALQPGAVSGSGFSYCDCTISIPEISKGSTVSSGSGDSDYVQSRGIKIHYTNCRIKSGPTGPSTSADGRLAARTYSFEAEGFTVEQS